MKNDNLILSKLTKVLLCSGIISLSGCNGGGAAGGSSSGTSTMGAATASIAAATGNSCITLVPTSNGKNFTSLQNSSQYYSTADLSYTIQNTCSTSQAMNAVEVTVSGLALNNNPAAINYIEQAQGTPYLSLTYTTSGKNVIMKISTPSCSGQYCDWANMPANSTRVFTIHTFVGAAISSFTTDGLTINGGTPTPTPSPIPTPKVSPTPSPTPSPVPTPSPSPSPSPVPVPSPTPVSTGSLTTLNDQIVDSKGNVVQLKGVNWFGFNNGDMLNGMWNYDGLSGDFETTVRRLKALGFNAVRLPFSFVNLNAGIQSTYNRTGVAPATDAQLISNLTNPSYSISGKTLPQLSYLDGQTYSNQYLPNTTTMNRFLYVIDFFARNGFYVLIDNHTEDNSMTSNQTTWINNWKSLASNIVTNLPTSSSQRIMYDIRNEPDAVGYNWSQMGPIYLSAMDAINTVTKGNNLFFIEGSGQGGINANWGDGFVIDKTLISQKGLSDPNSFFTSLSTKSYLNQVVLSPHVYPPTITNATADYYGSGLYGRLSASFGTLAKTGYCVNAICHKFPIAIGEFGSFFKDSRDFLFFTSFANYMNNNNDAIDGKHNAVNNWFYWSYNPNSGDTGGIVDNDWKTVLWTKINYLSNGTVSGTSTNPTGLGLNPWYK